MNTPTFDLVEIVKTIRQHLKLILGITLAAAIIGAIGYKMQDKKSKSEAEVYLTNPLFGDRNNIMRRSDHDIRFVDYFGTEGDVDRIMTMIGSTDVADSVISYMGLYKAYKLDPNNKADRVAMRQRFNKSLEAKRTDNCSVMASFADTDPQRAADVLNAVISITDAKVRKYIADVKTNSMKLVVRKIEETDKKIAVYTDSLVALRNQYQIFDLISPTRRNVISGNMKANSAKGVEEVQNVEAIKDQLVISRAELTASAYELESSMTQEIQLLHNVSTPRTPDKASGIGGALTVIACAFVAFFFSVLLLSFTAYVKALANTER
jgi:uncharacterized protein involved in exopolysaccharide biosynthesis